MPPQHLLHRSPALCIRTCNHSTGMRTHDPTLRAIIGVLTNARVACCTHQAQRRTKTPCGDIAGDPQQSTRAIGVRLRRHSHAHKIISRSPQPHSALDELLQAAQPHFGTRALEQAVTSARNGTNLPAFTPPSITPPSSMQFNPPSLPDTSAFSGAAQSALNTVLDTLRSQSTPQAWDLPATTTADPHFGTRAASDALQQAADALQRAATGNDALNAAAEALGSLQAAVASAVSLPAPVAAAVEQLAEAAQALARTAEHAVALPAAPWADGGVQRASDAVLKAAASLQANGAGCFFRFVFAGFVAGFFAVFSLFFSLFSSAVFSRCFWWTLCASISLDYSLVSSPTTHRHWRLRPHHRRLHRRSRAGCRRRLCALCRAGPPGGPSRGPCSAQRLRLQHGDCLLERAAAAGCVQGSHCGAGGGQLPGSPSPRQSARYGVATRRLWLIQ